ncbi:hypothetical protein Mapa_007711 [Marchantia paleacea]|nr:hypothetical protein Mapa_007711 [Marchantia paleacea]
MSMFHDHMLNSWERTENVRSQYRVRHLQKLNHILQLHFDLVLPSGVVYCPAVRPRLSVASVSLRPLHLRRCFFCCCHGCETRNLLYRSCFTFPSLVFLFFCPLSSFRASFRSHPWSLACNPGHCSSFTPLKNNFSHCDD